MEYILDLLNKIKWSKNENPDDYSIGYIDMVEKKIIEMPYNKIKRIEGTFFVIDKDDEETFIPTHRIRVVKKNNKVIWKR